MHHLAAAFAQSSPPQPSRPASPKARTSSGPAICPAANAAVILASNGVGSAGIRSCASCRPAMLATMKVPPTSTADAASDQSACVINGSAVPSAMAPCASAQTRRRGQPGSHRAAAATETAAASPKIGHVRPNTSGSSTSWRAMVGREVAGTM